MKNFSHHIVGGLFGTSPQEKRSLVKPFWGNRPHKYFFNGRSAIFTFVNSLQPKTVWLPSFLCHTIVDAVKKTGCKYKFYPIDINLELEDAHFIETLTPGDLVIIIDYFGLNPNLELTKKIQQKGATSLLDLSHASLKPSINVNADITLYNPRKSTGIPSCALLVSKGSTGDTRLFSIKTTPPDSNLEKQALEAPKLRSEWDNKRNYCDSQQWFKQGKKLESMMPIGNIGVSMSFIELFIESSSRQTVEAKIRRDNYNLLLSSFSNIALFKKIPDDSAPLGFPVYLQKRDKIQQTLYKNKIFCPVHWPLKDVVDSNFISAHKLSDHILTIPCDQRLNLNDMTQVVSSLKEAVSE